MTRGHTPICNDSPLAVLDSKSRHNAGSLTAAAAWSKLVVMQTNEGSDTVGSPEEQAPPFLAPCRDLKLNAPFGWIRKGIADFNRARPQSLIYGTFLVGLSWLVSGTAWALGSYFLVFALLSGFVFIGPVLAICSYSISRQLERDDLPTIRRCLISGRRHIASAMVFSLVLMVVFLVWARAASMIHVFFPLDGEYQWRDLLPFLGIGSAVGSLFAAFTFGASAFSLPMLVDRKVDIVTAVVTSINAVLRNKFTMVIWVAIIVLGVAIGFATAFIGLAVILPVLGYATWHSYRDCIDPSAWPPQPPLPGDSAYAESDKGAAVPREEA